MEITDLQKLVLDFREARNWGVYHTPKDVALGLCLEAAEAAQLLQWRREERLSKLPKEVQEDLAQELSDVLYWVLLMAADAGIDIEKSFKEKMDKNCAKYPIDATHTKLGVRPTA